MKKLILVVLVLFLSLNAEAYYETHPPYKFKQGPFKHAPDKPLPDKDIPSFIKKALDPIYLGPDVYQFDIDGNGTQDFIVFTYPGTGTLLNEIHIYLKKPDWGYVKISYPEDGGASIEDIVDINKDGKWEVILTNLYSGEKHNYLSYSIYEIRNYRLVNADKKSKRFPKFVWFTNKPNDKDTKHLTSQERQKHVDDKNASIEYEEIK